MTSILKADTIQDTDGNNIINENSNTITIGASGDTISIPSGATIANSGTATGFGGANTPAFQAYMSSNQVLSNDIETLLQFNTEDFDTAGAYDHSTNYRFTPQTAGKYFVYAMVLTSGDANSTLLGGGLFVRKNGSKVLESRSNPKNNNGRAFTNSISIILDLNGSSDYVDMFGVVDQSGGTPTIEAGTRFSRFGAYKIIE